MAIAWGRRVLTGLVGIPTALWLLSSDLGMLLLATTLCCLSLVEYTATICVQIVPQPKEPIEKVIHRVLVTVSGAVLCIGAWTGGKLLHGKMWYWLKRCIVADICGFDLADALSLATTLAIFAFHIATTKQMNQTGNCKDISPHMHCCDVF
ncbi:hypothetical protein P3T76_009159 [Phytophthora citrophthora]|uniref:Uncharacterized protein n=1 Tax=Phytophthora citrophthora TaxID=4793 RepID=A0AAD9GGF1_9STRA|nr:hypothetical protein P3T76_009159 [Phytophthora citrophthora]